MRTLFPLYDRLNRQSGGILSIPVDAAQRFSRSRATETAAGLAFYAVFSLFPLISLLVALASSILPRDQIFALLFNILLNIVPISSTLISDSINRFIEMRGTISLVAGLGFLWSASSVFTILVYHISAAWEEAHLRSYIHNRLIAIAIIIAIILLIAVLWLASTVLRLVADLYLPFFGNSDLFSSFPLSLLSRVTPPLMGLFAFYLLYRYVPATRVRWEEAGISAVVVLLVWEATAYLFVLFTGFQLSSYNNLYGSVTTLALLMLWFYINSLILLFGAHLSAGIARFRGVRQGQLTPVTHGEVVAKAKAQKPG